MNAEHVVALVSGANRGLGREFATELVARGAKLYAAARRPETVDVPGAIPVQLDITDAESIRRAAEVASDVNVVVNNAGVSTRATLLDGTLEDVRLLIVLSVLSWLHPATYIPADQKTDPGVVARLALDGLYAGDREVLADDMSKHVKAQLSSTA